ncbi:transposase IS3/IS911 family protein [Thermincola ferriacetica]|uniref:Transposase IS3/IS911 family protein n=1 Tax=Thermincola ferriacetica TaxID=281456 RepID=A0A0L6W3S9_9FIRM|nr:hypothetical protein [Thermincola ferriacetica]KNZ70018.1 transposase IS3/IS911 family protein [Thermincola ferriacetica]
MLTKPRKRWTPEEKGDIVLHALRQEMTQSDMISSVTVAKKLKYRIPTDIKE